MGQETRRRFEASRCGRTWAYFLCMPCMFCGAEKKMSKEHLWPQWARRTYDAARQREAVPHSFSQNSTEVPYETWNAQVFTATLKRVCEECNNGWMSALEARAKPHAEPLLLGERSHLDREAQTAIALWAHLKCLLVAQLDERLSEVLAGAGPAFFRVQEVDLLPPEVDVFTAHHIGALEGQYQHRLLGLEGKPALLVQTFTIRQLTLQVVRNCAEASPPRWERHPVFDEVQRQIWPPGPTFEWPAGEGPHDFDLTLYTGPEEEGSLRPLTDDERSDIEKLHRRR